MVSKDKNIELVQTALARALPGCSFERVKAEAGERCPPFIAVWPPSRFAVEIESVSASRTADVLGRFAVAVLESRSPKAHDGNLPFVVVVLPRLGAKMARVVEGFVSRHASKLSWALIDRVGASHVRIVRPALDPLTVVHRPRDQSPNKRQKTSRATPFSDLNRWMLKLLLLRDAPDRHWSGFRGKVQNPTQLSRIAEVSVETAHQFVRTFTARDFLRVESGDLKLVRKRELLETWLAEERQGSSVVNYARTIDGGPFEVEGILRSGRGAAVGGFEACRRHGMLHTAAGGLMVLVEGSSSELIRAWDLDYCGEHEAQLSLVEPRHKASVFRAVGNAGGVPVVDILQAALDVAPTTGRGVEQAELIVEEILSWGMA
jgi:hypothetical protein